MTAIAILLLYTLTTLASEPYQSQKLNGLNFASVFTVLSFACIKLLLVSVTRSPVG